MHDVFRYALERICDFMAWPIGHVYEVVAGDAGIQLRSMALWYMRDPEKAA